LVRDNSIFVQGLDEHADQSRQLSLHSSILNRITHRNAIRNVSLHKIIRQPSGHRQVIHYFHRPLTGHRQQTLQNESPFGEGTRCLRISDARIGAFSTTEGRSSGSRSQRKTISGSASISSTAWNTKPRIGRRQSYPYRLLLGGDQRR